LHPIFLLIGRKNTQKKAFDMMSLTSEKDLPCKRTGVLPLLDKCKIYLDKNKKNKIKRGEEQ